MAYTWTNGELITAEKLNQTGGGSFSISIIPAVLAVTESVTVAGESSVNLTSANSQLQTRGGEALDYREGIFVPFGGIGAESGGPYLVPSMSIGFYDEDFSFGIYNPQNYEQSLFGETILTGTFYKFS